MHQVILRLKPGGWKKLPPGLEDHGLALLFRQVMTGLPNGKEHLITTLNFQHTRVGVGVAGSFPSGVQQRLNPQAQCIDADEPCRIFLVIDPVFLECREILAVERKR